MTNLRKRQREALAELYDYDAKLLNALPKLAEGLLGKVDLDTLSYLNAFMEGLNWVIEVTNGCMDYINGDKIRINSIQVRNTMDELNQSYLREEYATVSQILQNGVETFLKDMQRIANELIS